MTAISSMGHTSVITHLPMPPSRAEQIAWYGIGFVCSLLAIAISAYAVHRLTAARRFRKYWRKRHGEDR